jgi:hypothetical protein
MSKVSLRYVVSDVDTAIPFYTDAAISAPADSSAGLSFVTVSSNPRRDNCNLLIPVLINAF